MWSGESRRTVTTGPTSSNPTNLTVYSLRYRRISCFIAVFVVLQLNSAAGAMLSSPARDPKADTLLEEARAASVKRLQATWEDIFARYGAIAEEDDDVVDLRTETLVVDKGIVRNTPSRKFGTMLAEMLGPESPLLRLSAKKRRRQDNGDELEDMEDLSEDEEPLASPSAPKRQRPKMTKVRREYSTVSRARFTLCLLNFTLLCYLPQEPWTMVLKSRLNQESLGTRTHLTNSSAVPGSRPRAMSSRNRLQLALEYRRLRVLLRRHLG